MGDQLELRIPAQRIKVRIDLQPPGERVRDLEELELVECPQVAVVAGDVPHHGVAGMPELADERQPDVPGAAED